MPKSRHPVSHPAPNRKTGKKKSAKAVTSRAPSYSALEALDTDKISPKRERLRRSESLTVVYIHGIANKPAPAILKREWDQALFGVDMGARTRMAYWADIRYPQPLSSGARPSDVVGRDH